MLRPRGNFPACPLLNPALCIYVVVNMKQTFLGYLLVYNMQHSLSFQTYTYVAVHADECRTTLCHLVPVVLLKEQINTHASLPIPCSLCLTGTTFCFNINTHCCKVTNISPHRILTIVIGDCNCLGNTVKPL